MPFPSSVQKRWTGSPCALSSLNRMSDRSGIVGIGLAGPFRHQPRSGLELAAQAFQTALADAGLERGHIDGLIVNIGGPAGPDHDQFAKFAGLHVRAALQ